jgi:hypothetical protein
MAIFADVALSLLMPTWNETRNGQNTLVIFFFLPLFLFLVLGPAMAACLRPGRAAAMGGGGAPTTALGDFGAVGRVGRDARDDLPLASTSHVKGRHASHGLGVAGHGEMGAATMGGRASHGEMRAAAMGGHPGHGEMRAAAMGGCAGHGEMGVAAMGGCTVHGERAAGHGEGIADDMRWTAMEVL